MRFSVFVAGELLPERPVKEPEDFVGPRGEMSVSPSASTGGSQPGQSGGSEQSTGPQLRPGSTVSRHPRIGTDSIVETQEQNRPLRLLRLHRLFGAYSWRAMNHRLRFCCCVATTKRRRVSRKHADHDQRGMGCGADVFCKRSSDLEMV